MTEISILFYFFCNLHFSNTKTTTTKKNTFLFIQLMCNLRLFFYNWEKNYLQYNFELFNVFSEIIIMNIFLLLCGFLKTKKKVPPNCLV